MAGIHGQGTTAANNVTFAAGKPIVNGKGAGCGQCWHLQATADPFPQNGKTWGTPVVAIINDQCTDGGYCDQTESHPLNTGYGKQVHFDLCGETGTAQQFFGALGMGVLTGYAQQVDCSMLSKGTQGSGAGNLVAPEGGGSPSATWKHAANGPAATSNIAAAANGLAATSDTPPAGNGAAATSSTASAATSNPTRSPWSNSTTSQQNSGQSTGGQSSSGQSSGGQSSGGQSSGGQSNSDQGNGGQNSGGQGNGGQSSSGQGNGGQSGSGGSVNSGGNTQSSNAGTQPQQQHIPSVKSGSQAPPANQQTTPQNPQKVTKPPQQQQQQQQQQQGTTGHSHGSMKGLEDVAFKAAPGGVDSMKQAMETYMQEALAGNAPANDGDENGEEDDECSEE